MCVHGFQGKGYSPEYVENFWKIFNSFKSDENTLVKVIEGPDEICRPCPNNLKRKCTPSGNIDEARIRALDDAYSATLQLKSGEVMTWKEVKERVVRLVTDTAFDKNCEICAWKKAGYCKSALVELREKLK